MSLGSRSLVMVLTCLSCTLASGATARRDPHSEETAIRALDRRWEEAIVAKDLDGTLAPYADDAAFLAPNAAVSSGKPAIRSAWAEFFKSPGLSLTFGPITVRVSRAADMAYEIGTYTMSLDGPNGRVEEQGKYVVVWTRMGSDWKVAADISNSSRPPTVPAGS